MSDPPAEAPDPQAEMPDPESDAPLPPVGPGWFRRLTSVLFIIFCFELGLFLLIYPWTDGWGDNYMAWAIPGEIQARWRDLWNNSFVRGAVSGLGVVNLWIALAEVFRLFTRRPPPS